MKYARHILVLAALAGVSPFAVPSSAKERPNIVIFFTDDAGYRDIGPFGGLAPTPNLDRMAAEGMKLTSFYVASVACTPSRAALMTGCYASRIGMDGGVVFPGDARGLHPEEITLAEMLNEAGYTTGCFGKWHLGDQPEFMPLAQGFDEYQGIPYSNDMWDYLPEKAKREIASGKKQRKKVHPPLPWMKGNDVVAWIDGPLSQALMNDAIAEATVDFIDRHHEAPFFIFVPFPSTHNPKFALKDRAEKLAALGCDPRHVQKYAQISEIDACVGRVMAALKRYDISANTLLFYTNDNGGGSNFHQEGLIVPRGGKFGPKHEGNMRMSTLAWWPGQIPAGSVCDAPGSTIDLLPTIARLTGATVPTDRGIDGKDISEMLLSGGESPHTHLYLETGGVRRGEWKLVTYKARPEKGANATFHAELYDLEKDFGETTDFADQHPEIVEHLQQALTAHIDYLSRHTRPPGDSQTAEVILKETSRVPTLEQYLGREGEKVYGEN